MGETFSWILQFLGVGDKSEEDEVKDGDEGEDGDENDEGEDGDEGEGDPSTKEGLVVNDCLEKEESGAEDEREGQTERSGAEGGVEAGGGGGEEEYTTPSCVW